MSRGDRDRWDSRYAGVHDRAAPPAETLRWIPPARHHDVALDLASGTGRHARALLAAGYRVVAADISRVGLLAFRAGLAPAAAAALVQVDVGAWPFEEASFDVVVQIDFLDREALPAIREVVRPGGLLLIDTFAGKFVPGRSGPQRDSWRLEHGELAARFVDWDVLRIADDPLQDRAAILARRPPGGAALR